MIEAFISYHIVIQRSVLKWEKATFLQEGMLVEEAEWGWTCMRIGNSFNNILFKHRPKFDPKKKKYTGLLKDLYSTEGNHHHELEMS